MVAAAHAAAAVVVPVCFVALVRILRAAGHSGVLAEMPTE